MCKLPLTCLDARISPRNSNLRYTEVSKNGCLADGTSPYHIVCAFEEESNLGKNGNHYLDARRRELRMESRNEMCRANNEEGTTGYEN
jgi:hypothetical protein